MLSSMISISSCRPFSFYACLRLSSEICTFVKCIVCIFSSLVTPKLQTSGLTRKGRPFFITYQTHFLRQYLLQYIYPLPLTIQGCSIKLVGWKKPSLLRSAFFAKPSPVIDKIVETIIIRNLYKM